MYFVVKLLAMRYPGKKAEMIGHVANAVVPAVPAGFFLADAIKPLSTSLGFNLFATGMLMLPPLALMVGSQVVAKLIRREPDRDWRLDSRMHSRGLAIDSLGVAMIAASSAVDQILHYHNKDIITISALFIPLSLTSAFNFGLKAYGLSMRMRQDGYR